jgi:membrane protein DedA with SNARE-associated domain
MITSTITITVPTTSMSEVEHFLASMEPFIRDYGVVAVFAILTFESIGFPLPGESLLIFASVLAERGEMSFPGLLFFAWIGGVAGDNIGYLIGRRLGRKVVLQYGQMFWLNADRLQRVETVFQRYGPVTVAFARFFNVLRQLNGVVAGTLRMDWWKFLLCNALGCALWVLTWGLAGFFLAEHVSEIKRFADGMGLIGAALIATGLIVLIVHRARRPRHGT